MYLPAHFREDDITVLHDFIRENNFGILVTHHEGAPFATHMPFLFDAGRGPQGTLMAHMALGNPQWRTFSQQREALAIFSGPHAYVTPSWYEVELSVPTWNYAIVHAYGTLQLIEDTEELRSLLNKLVRVNEAGFEQPWPNALPEDYMQKMMRGVVGFTMQITRLEGKFKLSQNRNPREQARVIAEFEETHPDVAQVMRDLYARKARTSK
jgi:transcriptional regulator